MMKKLPYFTAILAASMLVAPSVSASQSGASSTAAEKPAVPSREDYPDAGQAFGMVWHYTNYDEEPLLSFMVPETDNQLWTMRCDRQDDGTVRIAHMIIATPKELVAGDHFGFTVRVDDNPSIGLLGRLLPAQIEGDDYTMPQFYLPNNHALFPALARGKRAYVNLNGNMFSVHLTGSGEALVSFLRACR